MRSIRGASAGAESVWQADCGSSLSRIVRAREECPSIVRDDCVPWLVELDRAQPSVVVHARDEAGRDLVAVHVEIDGRTVAEALDGNPIPVDPGTHTVRCEATGRAPSEQRILVAQGDKGRPLTVDLPAPAALPSPAAAAAVKPTGPPIAAYATGGIALAPPWGVRTPRGHRLLGQESFLDAGCGQTHSCSDAVKVAPTRTQFIGAGVALGVGVVATAVTIGLFLHLICGGAPATRLWASSNFSRRFDSEPLRFDTKLVRHSEGDCGTISRCQSVRRAVSMRSKSSNASRVRPRSRRVTEREDSRGFLKPTDPIAVTLARAMINSPTAAACRRDRPPCRWA